ERRAFRARARELELAAHRARQLAGDGEPKARPPGLGRGGNEGLKKARAQVLAHALALVDDIDLAAALDPQRANGDDLFFARGLAHRLRRVAEEICEDAVEVFGIGYAGKARLHVDAMGDLARPAEHVERRLLGDGRDVDAGKLGRLFVGAPVFKRARGKTRGAVDGLFKP